MPSRRPLFALATAVLALASLELVARLVPVPTAPAFGIAMVADYHRIWRLDTPAAPRRGPPLYRVDADGLRVGRWQGPESAPLVLTIGDSSIFGQDVADGDTIHDRVGSELQARGVDARTGTLAVPGYSSTQAIATLDRVGWAKQPKLLVLAQLWSDAKLDVMRDEDLVAALHSPLGEAEWLLTESALFVQLRRGVNAALRRSATRRVSWPVSGQLGVRRVPLAQYRDNLRAIVDEARRRDVGVVFLALANEDVLRRGHVPEASWTPYFEVFYAAAAHAGAPLVKATEAFAAVDVRRPLGDGIHPNRDGAWAIGRAVAGALVDAGWPAQPLIPEEIPAFDVPKDDFDGVLPAEATTILGTMADE